MPWKKQALEEPGRIKLASEYEDVLHLVQTQPLNNPTIMDEEKLRKKDK